MLSSRACCFSEDYRRSARAQAGPTVCVQLVLDSSLSLHGNAGVAAVLGLICYPKGAAFQQVCVESSQRRKGIARRMLQGYKVMIQNMLPQVQSMNLICKLDLIVLYKGAGFEVLGPSEVIHGKDQWYEMKQVLNAE